MAALNEHRIKTKDGMVTVDCTLKPLFDHFLEEERERRHEEFKHREKLYGKYADLDRRVTRLETKVAVYAVSAAALFQIAVTVFGKVLG